MSLRPARFDARRFSTRESDPATGNPVGAVVLHGVFNDHGDPILKSGHVTGGPYAAVSGGLESSNYWDSIQSCGLSSAAQIQAAVQNAVATNTLFKLSNADRTRLQQ